LYTDRINKISSNKTTLVSESLKLTAVSNHKS
jgi:hypothetical protein